MNIAFEISYKLALKWKCHKDKLSELQFYQFSIQAESDDLLILKGYLDCKTTYSGIKELYSNAELTLQQESTKVRIPYLQQICTLISRLNGVYHHCRCFKKDLMNKHQIQELLTNVRKLANSKNICRALEFFESSNSYYIVYEELRAIQVVDLTHEDIQSIMFVNNYNMSGYITIHQNINRKSYLSLKNTNNKLLDGQSNGLQTRSTRIYT